MCCKGDKIYIIYNLLDGSFPIIGDNALYNGQKDCVLVAFITIWYRQYHTRP